MEERKWNKEKQRKWLKEHMLTPDQLEKLIQDKLKRNQQLLKSVQPTSRNQIQQ